MIHVRPVSFKDCGIERAAILSRAFSAVIVFQRAQQSLVQPHGHEYRNRIFRRDVGARVPQIEGIVASLDGRHIDVHEFNRMV